ncbi:MAG: excinuclease ABC subunit UvrA [Erysipelotrichales bacterium]
MKESNFKIIQIGCIQGDKNQIEVYKNFCKGLKYLSMFSHAIIIYKDDMSPNILNTNLCQKVIALKNVDEKKGIISSEDISNLNPANILYDIKPYFPNEDRVKNAIVLDTLTTKSRILYSNNLSTLGVIHKIRGSYYLEISSNFNEYTDILKGYSHIKILWWFHKFEKDVYKRTLECDPPYENAPKTGIFASRSPVRPNPFAITTAKILDFDYDNNMIKVSLLDCFDKTPLLGISPYIPSTDSIDICCLPSWVEHWSGFLDDSDFQDLQIPDLALPSNAYIRRQCGHLPDSNIVDADYFENKNNLSTTSNNGIQIKGARQHNLKNIDVTIPYNKISVITGVSGSGKSTLAFDTIYAESQHRFFSNMSLNERSRFSILEKPSFDSITGLPPAIAISQNSLNRNPRSTVGTTTDLHSLLRTLFSNIGVRHCPKCGSAIIKMTLEEIVKNLELCEPLTNLSIMPFKLEEKKQVVITLSKEDKTYNEYFQQLNTIVKDCLNEGMGAIQIQLNENEELIFQTTEKCYNCDHILFELSPSDFSYNNPESMCPVCKGLGLIRDIDVNAIVKYPNKSILDGASEFWGVLRKFKKSPNANWMKGEILALALHMNIDLENKWNDLPASFRTQAIYGSGQQKVSLTYTDKNGRTGSITRPVEGAYNILKRLILSETLESKHSLTEQFTNSILCKCCNGERLKIESRIVTINNRRFPDVINMSILELKQWVNSLPLHLDISERMLVQPILNELKSKLTDYIEIGLSYLTLDRTIPSLSGGELQRLHMVNQLNSGLSNILYILDEPTTGLHPKDYEMLMNIIYRLKEQNNTVIIVEHSSAIMLKADNIIDIGKGAGIYGGQLIAQGTPEEIMKNEASETGQYLSMRKQLSIKHTFSVNACNSWVVLNGVTGNNLKNINIKFPLNAITCITGVSGSGKSSLINCGILPAIYSCIENSTLPNKNYKEIIGANNIKNIIHITQKPIGRSSRSTPATFTGIMDEIRTVFSQTSKAKELNYNESMFSYNTKDGQCPACHGLGYKTLDIAFDTSNKIECPLCKGKKYNPSILKIYYNDKNIAQILDLTIAEALLFFENNNKLRNILQMLNEIGLGYIKLGQSSQTLSGGEAQRIKLATELMTNNFNDTLYLLDEPTTGLHFSDIQNLLHILSKITSKGNSVILVEHNLDVIRNADWIIDLGAGGGNQGGNLVVQGNLNNIMNCKNSHTGKLLKTSSLL